MQKGWNKYDARVLGIPSSEFQTSLETAESSRLESQTKDMTEAALEQVKRDNLELKRERDMPEDLSLLPTLHISDISLSSPPTPPVVQVNKRMERVHDLTNGVGYIRMKFSAEHIPEHLEGLIPVLTAVLGSVDAGKRDYKELALAQETYGGSMHVNHKIPQSFATGLYERCTVVEYDMLVSVFSFSLAHPFPSLSFWFC